MATAALLLLALEFSTLPGFLLTRAQEMERPHLEEELKRPDGKPLTLDDVARSLLPREERARRNAWESAHPGDTYEQFVSWVNFAEKNRTQTTNTASRLLEPPAATGWTYLAEGAAAPLAPQLVNFDVPMSAVTRNLDGIQESQRSDFGAHFTIVETFQSRRKPFEGGRLVNVIRMNPRDDPGDADLTRFFQVNARMLHDLPQFGLTQIYNSRDESSRRKAIEQKSRSTERLRGTDAFALTGTRLDDGREILTIFDLKESARTGVLRGDMYLFRDPASSAPENAVARNENQLAELTERGLERYLKDHPASGQNEWLASVRFATNERRVEATLKSRTPALVYYYGDDLHLVNLPEMADLLGHTLIHLSPTASRNLGRVDSRLRQIEQRHISSLNITVLNGLPGDPDEVRAMGPFVGPADRWLKTRRQYDEALERRPATRIDSKESLFSELSAGTSDVFFLVAHSTGVSFFLNGEKLSVKDLERLPRRKDRSLSPRIAYLIVCAAGRYSSDKNLWSKYLSTKVQPLAQILIDKNFFDEVIAPDHNVEPAEGLRFLNRALRGDVDRAFFQGWVNWARHWRQPDEVPS